MMKRKASVRSLSVLKRVWQQGKDVNRKDVQDGSTALHLAVESGNRLLVWLLLKNGADANSRDGHGRTALHLACESDDHSNSEKVVLLLLMHGADVNVQNASGETCLHVACWAGNVDVVGVLLKNGASQSVVDRHGLTPLHVVAHLRGNETYIADVLLKHSADVNAVDSLGRSPLHWACSFKGMLNVEMILSKGSNVNLQDSHGDTPLHLASVGNRKEIVSILINNGATINATNINHRTALHLAASIGSFEIMNELIEMGADVNAKDSSGDTPLHLAVSWASKNECIKTIELAAVVKTFLNNGAKLDVKNSLQKSPFENIIEFGEQFRSRDNESTHDKESVAKLTNLFIEHVIKLKTANLEEESDITNIFGSVKYDILQMLCAHEILCLKRTIIIDSLSLYEVFSRVNKPYLWTNGEFLAFNEYLKNPDLLNKFPLYGQLLRTTFENIRWSLEAAEKAFEFVDKTSPVQRPEGAEHSML